MGRSTSSSSLIEISTNFIMMKLFVFALVVVAAMANPIEEENDFAKECLDIKDTCMAAAKDKLERAQCWMQFGLCVATHGMKCYTMHSTNEDMHPRCRPRFHQDLELWCRLHQMCHLVRINTHLKNLCLNDNS